MGFALSAGPLLAVASGVALALLGAAVLRIRPLRLPALAFGAFAILWGAQVAAANISTMATDVATSVAWTRGYMLLLIPLYLPLLLFASSFPWPSNALARSPAVFALAAAPAVALLLVAAAAPEILLLDVAAGAAGAGIPKGALFDTVQVLNSILAFVVALEIVARKLWGAWGVAEREQLGLVVVALAAFVSYRVVDASGRLLSGGSNLAASPPEAALLLGALGLGFLVLGRILLRALARRDLPWRTLLLVLGLLPPAFALLEAALRLQGIPPVISVGVWRLAMVGLFAYAIARYRIFDLELRLQALAPGASYAAAAATALGALWALGGEGLARAPLLGVLASAGALAACVPLARLGGRAARRAAPQVPTKEYLYKRKLDLYRAALEEAEAGDYGKDTEQAFLEQLRRDLGISEKEHRVILVMLQYQHRQAPKPLAATAGTRFRVERELGRGGFARAVLAHDTVLDRKVVLKQPHAPWALDAEGRKRFLQEARLAARIQHPNVVAVHEVLQDAEPPVLVLEYVAGGSLADLLEAHRRLAPERAVPLMLDVLAGLERIHQEGIVHRDLKPENILLDHDGRAKVTDFGIARPPPELALAATMAEGGMQPGSLPYMSPEQARGGDVDARSDLYAAGVVLYRALAGQPYVDLGQRSPPEARRLIQEAPPRLPAEGVPAALEPVLAKALAKDRARRYRSAAEMRAALEAASGRRGPGARKAPART